VSRLTTGFWTSTMNCAQVTKEEITEKYLLGRLTEAEQGAFELHFFECERCFEEVESLRMLQTEAPAGRFVNSRAGLQATEPVLAPGLGPGSSPRGQTWPRANRRVGRGSPAPTNWAAEAPDVERGGLGRVRGALFRVRTSRNSSSFVGPGAVRPHDC
jgi:anti-sigma factor RsiW